MLKSQEIQLTQSKRREKMAEIQKADEITDDARTELRSLPAVNTAHNPLGIIHSPVKA